jgi:phosphatidylglycerophosphate synthase
VIGLETGLFGMTLLERTLHALREADTSFEQILIDLPIAEATPDAVRKYELAIPATLREQLPLEWRAAGDASLDARLAGCFASAATSPLIALSGDTVVDGRVMAHLCQTPGSFAFISGDAEERGAALRLEADASGTPAAEPTLVDVAEHAVASGVARPFSESGFDPYVTMLRRTTPPYLFRVPNAKSRKRIERFLFWSNYKGSTDFLTRYVYPPFVWALVRPLSHRRVHPNWVTTVDWLAAFLAIPFFMWGAWLPGLALGYLMSVLDSVDGKLARLTYTSSPFGEIFDHGLDIIHPPLWYLAWGYGLGGGDTQSLPFQASVGLFGIYVIDRILAGVFKGRTGKSIHGYTPLDERARTFISRRNTNMAMITVAVVYEWWTGTQGAAEWTFYFVVLWQLACLVWHAERLVRFWGDGRKRSA